MSRPNCVASLCAWYRMVYCLSINRTNECLTHLTTFLMNTYSAAINNFITATFMLINALNVNRLRSQNCIMMISLLSISKWPTRSRKISWYFDNNDKRIIIMIMKMVTMMIWQWYNKTNDNDYDKNNASPPLHSISCYFSDIGPRFMYIEISLMALKM